MEEGGGRSQDWDSRRHRRSNGETLEAITAFLRFLHQLPLSLSLSFILSLHSILSHTTTSSSDVLLLLGGTPPPPPPPPRNFSAATTLVGLCTSLLRALVCAFLSVSLSSFLPSPTHLPDPRFPFPPSAFRPSTHLQKRCYENVSSYFLLFSLL
eukprot:NODE_2380_length_1215_cov_6.268439_g2172_i0.p1 GENE.NODE_2380_length_1215_cov_6.268439_g2172_i0~~NODE_2380_length_1215_cov_6.268439_g2172_i0.p1  ORF type:complete len:154 (+),score=15.00 NODE_2380_length_1215_cov_6.268439_g2172_i0:737-1198(+)